MEYLLDTNVASETFKLRPDAGVDKWLKAHESKSFISVITIGELTRGMELLDQSKRKTQLKNWINSLCERMHGRILNFNMATALTWGRHTVIWQRQGIVVPFVDSLIAATAISQHLTIVTRNTADFSKTGIRVLNPFSKKSKS